MRTFLLLASAFFLAGTCAAPAWAGNLVYAEYFFDVDPGQGNGTSVLPCDGVFDEAVEEFCLENISAPELGAGLHTLFLRLRDSDNVWGQRQMSFYVLESNPYVDRTVEAAEFSVDGGVWQDLNAADGTFDENAEELIALALSSLELSVGQHEINVRGQDSWGVWGQERSRTFQVMQANPYHAISAAEYFIGNDPGEGQGAPLVSVDGAFDQSIEWAQSEDLSTNTWEPAAYSVFVRFRDNQTNCPPYTGWGAARSIDLCLMASPDLLSPLHQDTLVSKRESLRWHALTCCNGYTIEITDSAGFSYVTDIADPNIGSLNISGLLTDSTWYYWRVAATYESQPERWSDVQAFFFYPCCGRTAGGYTGNTNCDSRGKMDLADVTVLIDRIYLRKLPLCCEDNGNVDGDLDGKMNLADILKLIDHIYLSKQPTSLCP